MSNVDPMLDGITRHTFFRTDEVVDHEKLPDDYDGLYTDEYALLSDLPALIARVRAEALREVREAVAAACYKDDYTCVSCTNVALAAIDALRGESHV
jgi:hypothetical protein